MTGCGLELNRDWRTFTGRTLAIALRVPTLENGSLGKSRKCEVDRLLTVACSMLPNFLSLRGESPSIVQAF